MRQCYQSAGQDMLQHGEAVATEFERLYAHIANGAPVPDGWRLPTWLTPEAGELLVRNLPSLETLALYHRYHDCGKPRCRTVDDMGRQHFPNHAEVSRQVWLEAGGSVEVGTLIGMDMAVHTLKAEDVPDFAKEPEAAALLLTGLAEIHANAAMFGGTDSTSFKIKLKHLERRGKQIVQILKENCK